MMKKIMIMMMPSLKLNVKVQFMTRHFHLVKEVDFKSFYDSQITQL